MVEEPETRFRLVFASPRALECARSLGSAHEIEAESGYVRSNSTALESQSSEVGSAKTCAQPAKKKIKVAFSIQEEFTAVLPKDTPTSPAISDICLTLSTVTKQPKSTERKLLGCVTDGVQLHSMYYLRELAEGPKLQSLEDLLASSSKTIQDQMKGAFFFSHKDRLSLAVELAYSVLRLHGNWLKSHWRARDIKFIEKPTSELGHPALSLGVASGIETSTMCRDAANSSLIRNEILFPLGVVLIELSLCQSIKQLSSPEDHDDNEATATLKTATRWLRYVEPESGHLYGDAVEQCLFGRWRSGNNMEDETMQDEIYQRVVSPLAENLKNFVRGS